MSKFLKLTDSIINIKYIHSVKNLKYKYQINVISNVDGVWNIIEVRQDSSDYKIVSVWFDNQ